MDLGFYCDTMENTINCFWKLGHAIQGGKKNRMENIYAWIWYS